jgi:hypothetical protein
MGNDIRYEHFKDESSFLPNAPRFPTKNCIQNGTQSLPIRPFSKGNLQVKTNIENWWNDTDRKKHNY